MCLASAGHAGGIPISVMDAQVACPPAGWWFDPDWIINELGINSTITSPAHEEVVTLDSQKEYVVRGYAYSSALLHSAKRFLLPVPEASRCINLASSTDFSALTAINGRALQVHMAYSRLPACLAHVPKSIAAGSTWGLLHLCRRHQDPAVRGVAGRRQDVALRQDPALCAAQRGRKALGLGALQPQRARW